MHIHFCKEERLLLFWIKQSVFGARTKFRAKAKSHFQNGICGSFFKNNFCIISNSLKRNLETLTVTITIL